MNIGDIEMIKVNNLNFGYKDNRILKEIDILFQKNEFAAIIGPNGSGKTTLLKNISNIITPDSGFIYLNQKLLNDYSAAELARTMAVVPQDTGVGYNFSVYELIMMGRNPYQNRWGRIDRKDKEIVREVMELTDTYKFKDKKATELSGGERQRVIIARALAQKPEILLLDEPTASLDINYQGEIFDILASLSRELNLTIIVVSHDLNLTSQYCNKLILLNEGEIFRIGSPAEVLTAETIREVYQADVTIKKNPLNNRPYIILKPKDNTKAERKVKDKRIHVVCGGGSGEELLETLYNQGYKLSCGVLNQGDNDWVVAKKLDLEVAENPAFAPVDADSLDLNRRLMKRADLIIVTDTPFGYGNLDNLKLITELENKEIVLQNRRKIEKRDYTGGKAQEIWNLLVEKKNIHTAGELPEILNYIDRLI